MHTKMTKEDITRFRELINRFGEPTPLADGELGFLLFILFCRTEQPKFFAGPRYKATCETIMYLREIVEESNLWSLDKLIGYFDRSKAEVGAYLERLFNTMPGEGADK